MSVIENSTLAIVGAGSVGTSTAYAAMIRGSARHVRLYDIDAARVEAEVLDLAHGSQFTGATDIDGGADLRHVEGADVVVITAGAKQHPGQTRLDLAGTNVDILRSMLPKLLERAPDAVYLLVTNPCDVLTVAAQQITGLPSSRVFSSGTVLDTARLRWKLAQRAGVAQSSVHAHIVGEHGDTEFPLWSAASIGVTPLLDWERDGLRVFDTEELETLSDEVRNAAYKVIAGKGATNYAIGLSAARIVEAVLNDENAILPVSSVLDGFLDISGVALSIPTVVSASGVQPVTTTPFAANEAQALRDSAQALAQVQASLGI
ncbi:MULTISPECIES: L-lactate dehydrogenase [unclassified Nesterenkonia]|uniref:L-lactate dehydrogenase n=1 Tax=unclassified Nesterenkonia TaxID=2629769 RepID=UPI001F4D2620|nr:MULTISPECIES: L-lactate dehydrogenase [unclassified Nesterenkonia]MCH8559984.1 L-lactate dehydrogenase [Nesterenkonia sp. DZ6]MCH8562164.1 L-lactate dehydrogenase [Nesterenkonia sp. YGD6]MCH8569932.1 L-lactate dehydrogenase [Nesterenkonia sp. AY15]